MKFDSIALSLVGAFTVGLLVTASFNPPKSGPVVPRANFPRVALQDAEPLTLPEGISPQVGPVAMAPSVDDAQETIQVMEDHVPSLASAVNFELPDFTVASGAVGASAHALSSAFGAMGYHFDKVITGELAVPRMFLASLPDDISKVRENKQRKELFFSLILPLVLQVNEEILVDRKRLWKLRFQARIGKKSTAADRLWLEVMTERYRIKPGNPVKNIDTLIQRVDIVPPSLALAQAAEESGWGTSRFVREGNAIFGQWTFDETKGVIPKGRDKGKTHAIKAFPNLTASVRAYARNLNTHRAYREFRQTRAVVRRQGGPLEGRLLAGRLTRYSERGQAYVSSLRGLIDTNNLHHLDDARLTTGEDGPAI